MQTQRKTQIKKQQPQSQALSAEEIKERREAEQFNRCMKMMKIYCPNRGRYY